MLPPTLASLITQNVHHANIWCGCGHEARVRLDRFDPAMPFPDLARRLRCSKCGKRPETVMPAWEERRVLG